MKLGLLSSVSGAAMLAAMSPAMAGNGFSGVAQVNGSFGTTDQSSFFASDGSLDDPQSYGIKAKGLWTLSPDLHFQADLFYENLDNSVVSTWSSHESASTVGGAIHLLHPFESRARLGAAGSIWSNEAFVPANDGRSDITYGLAAVEGQFFGTDYTVTGQAGVFSAFECSGICPGSVDSGSYLRGKIRYFLHDNTSLSLETTQMWGKLNSDDDIFSGKSVNTNYAQWVLEAEHRFEGSPFSGTLAVAHERTEHDFFGASADTSSVQIGLKYYLDQPTLKSHDRTGAELDTPQFGNVLETSGALAFGEVPDVPE